MRNIGLILYPGFQVLGLAICAAFEYANVLVDEPAYSIHLLSEDGGPVATSVGFEVASQRFDTVLLDTLIVLADNEIRPFSPRLTDYLRAANRITRRMTSICTGTFALAEAGLLEGRRATTHWRQATQFQRMYPNVKLDADRIFVNDGSFWTSAGMSAGVDLALALIEDDLGVEVTRAVAKHLVLYHRRAGGQSQFSVMLELEPKTDRIQAALSYAREHLKADLAVEDLARVANLSPRQFSRVFQTETGQSPAKAIENLRVEAARLLLEAGWDSIDAVAVQTGFGDRERMRRAFVRAFGQPPQIIQRASRV